MPVLVVVGLKVFGFIGGGIDAIERRKEKNLNSLNTSTQEKSDLYNLYEHLENQLKRVCDNSEYNFPTELLTSFLELSCRAWIQHGGIGWKKIQFSNKAIVVKSFFQVSENYMDNVCWGLRGKYPVWMFQLWITPTQLYTLSSPCLSDTHMHICLYLLIFQGRKKAW